MQSKYWSVGEVAGIFGASEKWAYSAIKEGKIPGAFKIKGRWFIDREEFEKGLKELAVRKPKARKPRKSEDKHGLLG